jgi:plastocyanin
MKTMHRLSRIMLIAGCASALMLSAACSSGESASNTSTPLSIQATTKPATAATATLAAIPTASPAIGTDASPTPATGGPPRPVDATSAPPTQPAAAAPPPPTQAPPAPSDQSITVIAKNVKFSPSALVIAAGSIVHLAFDNQDAGVEHDIVIFDASGAKVASTDATPGPIQQSLTFMATAPRYVFKCSVHPQTMNGTLSAQ